MIGEDKKCRVNNIENPVEKSTSRNYRDTFLTSSVNEPHASWETKFFTPRYCDDASASSFFL